MSWGSEKRLSFDILENFMTLDFIGLLSIAVLQNIHIEIKRLILIA